MNPELVCASTSVLRDSDGTFYNGAWIDVTNIMSYYYAKNKRISPLQGMIGYTTSPLFPTGTTPHVVLSL